DTAGQTSQASNRHPGEKALPFEERPVIDTRSCLQAIQPMTGKPRTRNVRRDAALGFASEDFHYAGDRIVTLNEEVEVRGGKPTGRILHHFQRIDDQGRSLGTYEQAWEKEREGRMRSAGKARKYYSF